MPWSLAWLELFPHRLMRQWIHPSVQGLLFSTSSLSGLVNWVMHCIAWGHRQSKLIGVFEPVQAQTHLYKRAIWSNLNRISTSSPNMAEQLTGCNNAQYFSPQPKTSNYYCSVLGLELGCIWKYNRVIGWLTGRLTDLWTSSALLLPLTLTPVSELCTGGVPLFFFSSLWMMASCFI